MKVYRLAGEYLDENTYLLVEGEGALILDPGAAADRILRACESLKVTPLAVLLTHGHVDHIYGAPGLQEKGLPVYAHAEEFSVISGKANLAIAFHLAFTSFLPDHAVTDGQTLEIGPFHISVIYTPGHTSGGVCYLINGALFTGDTLFKGSYGRTDLPTGDEQDLLCSIANELFSLPHDTPVYAGHGDEGKGSDLALATPDTTIEEEYYTNPILHLL